MESAPSPARCLYGPSQRSTLAERGCTSDARRIRRCSHMRCPSLAAVGLSSLKPHSPAGGQRQPVWKAAGSPAAFQGEAQHALRSAAWLRTPATAN